jgi:predicted esterase
MKAPFALVSAIVTILAVGTSPVVVCAEAPVDIADMKVTDLRVGGDESKRYFVIHQPVEAPKEGWRTLFVLPGGPGGAEFQPFVTRIAKFAVPANYLVVQLVAPVWNPLQAQNNVWPSEKLPSPGMKFSTADFFLAVRADLAKTHKLDPRYSFTLTWSSSGTNGYLLSLHPKAGVKGSFVAMSVFKPDLLPPLAAAKGHPYFLYHSPQDFIPIAQAEAARDALQKAGGVVELQTYEGGHGWKGNVFGNIRTGITWLEEQAGKAPGKP